MENIIKFEPMNGDHQRSAANIIQREVYHTVGNYIELLQGGEDFFENVENLYEYEFNGDTYTEEEYLNRLEELQERVEGLECTEADKVELEAFEDLESEPVEVMQWFAVSERLYRWLKEEGEVVLDSEDCYIWGRVGCGQGIAQDYVIQKIIENHLQAYFQKELKSFESNKPTRA